jgi:hypothetical protein
MSNASILTLGLRQLRGALGWLKKTTRGGVRAPKTFAKENRSVIWIFARIALERDVSRHRFFY